MNERQPARAEREVKPKDVFARSNMPSRWERLTNVAPKTVRDRKYLAFVAARYRGDKRLPHPDALEPPRELHTREYAYCVCMAVGAIAIILAVAGLAVQLPVLVVVGASAPSRCGLRRRTRSSPDATGDQPVPCAEAPVPARRIPTACRPFGFRGHRDAQHDDHQRRRHTRLLRSQDRIRNRARTRLRLFPARHPADRLVGGTRRGWREREADRRRPRRDKGAGEWSPERRSRRPSDYRRGQPTEEGSPHAPGCARPCLRRLSRPATPPKHERAAREERAESGRPARSRSASNGQTVLMRTTNRSVKSAGDWSRQ